MGKLEVDLWGKTRSWAVMSEHPSWVWVGLEGYACEIAESLALGSEHPSRAWGDWKNFWDGNWEWPTHYLSERPYRVWEDWKLHMRGFSMSAGTSRNTLFGHGGIGRREDQHASGW